MGIFWELMQQEEMDRQKEKAETLEERVEHLEEDLAATRSLLKKTLTALEDHLQKDVDGDGKY